ncbi:hypothetical protein LX64_01666 [Chitinophaga skermanii]|uniref:DUF928 domain-containing protein n=1 Tax=Chitinophaga skermanii TaxID=331697 RepID=A0A327QPN2_9BACT|nr:hypothetical protein [Chitinophaga skermanii]RAJ06539.1 hypothetical protein LX64_01666 [Chitinophaga skermanii]
MRLYKYFLILCLVCAASHVQAQFSFTFMPEIHGRSMDGLMMVKIGNHTQEKKFVQLVVTVREAKAGQILTVRTAPFELYPGVTSPLQSSVFNSNVSFAQNKLASIVRQSNYFPEGDYEYCFALEGTGTSGEPGTLQEYCFDYQLQPLSPLMLLEPYEDETVCTPRPALFWQPMMPSIPGLQYRLVLVEVKPGQQKAEAIHYNMALVNQPNIPSPFLFYPAIARPLENGKTYAWQVTAYKNDVILGTSEIWTLNAQCDDLAADQKNEPVYNNIQVLAQRGYFVAHGNVTFIMDGVPRSENLVYSITCLNKPNLNMKRLPAVPLNPGLNLVNIDVKDRRSFVDGYFYLLKVELPTKETKEIRFLYKSK